MKNFIIVLALFFSHYACCQDTSLPKNINPNDQIQEYLKKSKARKITGFVMLGAGALVLYSSKSFIKGETEFNAMDFELIKLAVGAGLITVSILEFSSSAKFKRKAQLLLIKQKISGPLKLKDQLHVGISINL